MSDQEVNKWVLWLATALVALCLLLAARTVLGDDDRRCRHERREESHNYIIERQQAGVVEGVPLERRIIGRREIDIYRDGTMFERNEVVGVRK